MVTVGVYSDCSQSVVVAGVSAYADRYKGGVSSAHFNLSEFVVFKNKVDDKKDIYMNINSYLKNIFQQNNIDLEEINEKSNKIDKKDDDNDYKGIYCFQALNLQKNVLQIYKYLTKSIPNAQYILFCNKETTSEELTAFLYRAILCKLHSCFIIAGIELLPFKEKITFQSIFKDLYEKNEKKMKSCLVVAYMNTEADIVKYIHTLKKKFFKNILNDLENQNMDDINKNVEIINSDKSGVGKSTYIKKKIEKSGKEYIYFPLGGVFTRKNILNRLKKLNHKKGIKNSYIHLDLYDTEQIDLTMEFLFSLLITKIYGQNDDIFYLPKNIPIMVEIPNGFIPYMKKFPILDIFKKKTLYIEKLAPLIVPEKINSNVQIVANYLKLLKYDKDLLNSHDIYFEGINFFYNILESCNKETFTIISELHPFKLFANGLEKSGINENIILCLNSNIFKFWIIARSRSQSFI